MSGAFRRATCAKHLSQSTQYKAFYKKNINGIAQSAVKFFSGILLR